MFPFQRVGRRPCWPIAALWRLEKPNSSNRTCGILRGTNEAPRFGRQKDGILRGTNEAPRFGKPPKGNQMENKAKGILRGTNEAPSTLDSVADSGFLCIYIYIIIPQTPLPVGVLT